ncbi:MAG: aminoglycoside phosphotransferase family protein [Chloroflexota bacterium]|nr:MAG: aminoglycoside phosphotransferase family protein [Chloroflexota bacterium]
MIADLERFTGDDKGLEAPALRDLLGRLIDSEQGGGQLVKVEKLKAHVYRLHYQIGKQSRAMVVKRLDPDVAQRNRLVVQRWLPAGGMAGSAPRLLGMAPEADGQATWLALEDLGGRTLESQKGRRSSVQKAVESIARLHKRFAEHPLLAEVRLWGGELGMPFYASNVRDAQRCIEAIRTPAVVLKPEHRALRERLLERLDQLEATRPQRAELLQRAGGSETLLHGDLWISNVFVLQAKVEPIVRFIDWDHAAVGPVSYDLSTFLLRFPEGERSWIVDSYLDAVADLGWPRLSVSLWNQLFETAELSRITNRLIWPALAILDGDTSWGFDALSEIETWFNALRPVLSEDSGQPPGGDDGGD